MTCCVITHLHAHVCQHAHTHGLSRDGRSLWSDGLYKTHSGGLNGALRLSEVQLFGFSLGSCHSPRRDFYLLWGSLFYLLIHFFSLTFTINCEDQQLLFFLVCFSLIPSRCTAQTAESRTFQACIPLGSWLSISACLQSILVKVAKATESFHCKFGVSMQPLYSVFSLSAASRADLCFYSETEEFPRVLSHSAPSLLGQSLNLLSSHFCCKTQWLADQVEKQEAATKCWSGSEITATSLCRHAIEATNDDVVHEGIRPSEAFSCFVTMICWEELLFLYFFSFLFLTLLSKLFKKTKIL